DRGANDVLCGIQGDSVVDPRTALEVEELEVGRVSRKADLAIVDAHSDPTREDRRGRQVEVRRRIPQFQSRWGWRTRTASRQGGHTALGHGIEGERDRGLPRTRAQWPDFHEQSRYRNRWVGGGGQIKERIVHKTLAAPISIDKAPHIIEVIIDPKEGGR